MKSQWSVNTFWALMSDIAWHNMWFFSFTSFVLFFKANSLFIKFTSARNLISLRLLTLTSLFWVIVLWGSLIKWNLFFIHDGLKESLKSVTGKGCIVFVAFALTKGRERLKRQLWNSLRWPIYVANWVRNTKIPCYTLPPTEHHCCFRNLPPYKSVHLNFSVG